MFEKIKVLLAYNADDNVGILMVCVWYKGKEFCVDVKFGGSGYFHNLKEFINWCKQYEIGILGFAPGINKQLRAKIELYEKRVV